MRLKGKVALITGAGSGMGRATATLFAREGAKVAIVDINKESADETVRRITSAGGDTIAIRADVSNSEDARAMVTETVAKFGGLDIIYNNAGIEGEGRFMAEVTEEQFDRVIAINLRGVWLGMKYALPELVKRGGGVIISTASVAGMVGLKGATAYSAAKAGVIAMTRTAAIEYGRYNIRANCICPGFIHTEMADRARGGQGVAPEFVKRASVFGRFGEPDEIAQTALFLASDECKFATGQPFVIDGGWAAR
ncbi:MAG TPA: SDR family NAD(P)-dependent oxidoreductase [Candidatus Binataceae bacterium]|nr:SDR family NAD(P)-dependent oxidoreductase [Candidatus Binataceae bacterium]